MASGCPMCGEPVPYPPGPHRPFCSERCRWRDLSRWLDGSYAVPGEAVDPLDVDRLQRPED